MNFSVLWTVHVKSILKLSKWECCCALVLFKLNCAHNLKTKFNFVIHSSCICKKNRVFKISYNSALTVILNFEMTSAQREEEIIHRESLALNARKEREGF